MNKIHILDNINIPTNPFKITFNDTTILLLPMILCKLNDIQTSTKKT